MKAALIADWLSRKVRTAVILRLLGSVLVFLLALVALFITFWIIYVVVYIVVNWWWPHGHDARLTISGVVLGLIFAGYLTADMSQLHREFIEAGKNEHDAVTNTVASLIGPPGATLSPQAWVKALALLTCFGPHLMSGAVKLVLDARRWRAMDVDGCAAVLAALYASDERVSNAELEKALPPGHDWKTVRKQVRELGGVLTLKSEPKGLKLTDDFRRELRGLK